MTKKIKCRYISNSKYFWYLEPKYAGYFFDKENDRLYYNAMILYTNAKYSLAGETMVFDSYRDFINCTKEVEVDWFDLLK